MSADAQRDHEPGQVRAAQNQKAGDKTERRRNQSPETEERDDRLVDDAVFGEEAGKIAGEAEKGRLAQRDDAGIAEDQVERERKQRENRRLGQNQMLAREQPDGGEREHPKGNFQRRPAGAARQESGDAVGWGKHRTHRAALRPNKPCGRQIRTTIMIV